VEFDKMVEISERLATAYEEALGKEALALDEVRLLQARLGIAKAGRVHGALTAGKIDGKNTEIRKEQIANVQILDGTLVKLTDKLNEALLQLDLAQASRKTCELRNKLWNSWLSASNFNECPF
jgi:hypothetical protein